LLLLYSVIVPVFPLLVRTAIDRYIEPVEAAFQGLTIDERFYGLLVIAAIYLVLRGLNFGLRYGYTYLMTWMGQHAIYDIRREIFAKAQRLHLGFFDRTPVGRLMTRITSDIDAIEMMMRDGVVGLVADIALLIGLLVFMFVLNWQLALITLLVMPILFLAINVLRARIREAYRAVRLITAKSNAYLQENLSGMKTVQLFNREERNQQGYDKINLDLLDANIEQVRWFSLFFPVVQFIGTLSTALILYFTTVQVLGAVPGNVTIGVFTAFVL
jgi:ATP-binding cassette, subfamily B, multidrug efflux pump